MFFSHTTPAPASSSSLPSRLLRPLRAGSAPAAAGTHGRKLSDTAKENEEEQSRFSSEGRGRHRREAPRSASSCLISWCLCSSEKEIGDLHTIKSPLGFQFIFYFSFFICITYEKTREKTILLVVCEFLLFLPLYYSLFV